MSDTYRVVVVTSTLPVSYELTYDLDAYSNVPTTTVPPCIEGSPLYAECDNQSSVALFPGQVDRNHDFGYKPPRRIGDFVWLDTNNNGIQDTGEAGIGGVTIPSLSPVMAL